MVTVKAQPDVFHLETLNSNYRKCVKDNTIKKPVKPPVSDILTKEKVLLSEDLLNNTNALVSHVQSSSLPVSRAFTQMMK